MKESIQKVKDNKEKQQTYTIQMRKYKRAIKEDFHIEAICICYAMCEDRLVSFLYHSGCINRELKVTKKYNKSIRKIWLLKNSDKYNLNNISSKYNYILRMLEWSQLEHKDENEFETSLKKKIIGEVDIEELQNIIKNLNIWCNERNQIVHALLNKNVDELGAKSQTLAEDGYEIARALDNIVKVYKKKNNIRKKLGIQG